MSSLLRFFVIFNLFFLFLSKTSAAGVQSQNDEQQLPIEQRIEQLLAQMTVQEKVNQLLLPEVAEADLRAQYSETGVGAYYIYDTDDRNALQEFFMNNSRLRIPVSFVQEALHSGASGGTIYPMPCGMASTWNPALIQLVHEAIAMEVRTIGADRTFSPNINLYTDPRFGRIQEGFGEDPYLVSLFAMAAIQGLQGLDSTATLDSYLDDDHIASTAKHFAAYGRTTGGQDGTAADLSERTLREIYLRPFQAAVNVNVKAIMPAHEELNGIPCHANSWLLTDLLRNEWGWEDGLLSSDYGDIGGLVGYHMATDLESAALLAINAGVDLDLGAYSYPSLVNLTTSGQLSMEVLDRAVSNALRVKFASGLFDNPFAVPSDPVLDPPEHRQLALEVARQGIVLLKNDLGMLPITNGNSLRSIAVIGPNGNDSSNQAGGYTQFGAPIVTVLEGIQNFVANQSWNAVVEYEQGCYIDSENTTLLVPAMKLAADSDLAIVVVGDSQATCQESYSYRTGDRPDLDLPGGQLDLIAAILETGVPTIVVLINGRPATFGYNNTLLEDIPALLEAWRPGEEGGTAIAEIIFGSISPSGRLAVTFPWNVGEIGGPTQPYWQKYRYYDGMIWTFFPSTPLFSFGFGLTYTTFQYSDLSIEPSVVGIDPSSSVNVTFTLSNIGSREGTEVAQLYVADVLASVVRYKKQLFGFSKVTLQPGESTTVLISILISDLAFYNAQMQYVVEPGQFNVMVGPDASSFPLQGSFQVNP